jgi:alanine-glyoxylate transaminase/serine-glyoxylate transaminase/serine-pyruvate transaminase
MTKASRYLILQIPGPTKVPDRFLRATSAPTIDRRGPEFAQLTREVLPGLQGIFKTSHPVFVFPSSGTGAWKAAVTNALSPVDIPGSVRMIETHFGASSRGWPKTAQRR